MRVNRENFLRCLEQVTAGLAHREIIEQSGCFVFKNKKVMTFNDEVACINKAPVDLTGAIKAKPLLDLLSKLPDDDVDIKVENNEFELRGSSKTRKCGIAMESQVMLPIEHVEPPDDWRELHPDFTEAVKMVYECASTEESNFIYCCVHITPNFVETSDRFQIARYTLETGFENPILIRADAIKHVIGLPLVAVAETQNWVHFKSSDGLVIAVRRHISEYTNFDRNLVADGTEPIVLPAGIDEVVERSQVFSREDVHGNVVVVDLKPDRVVLEGHGPSGWYKELKKVTYAGTPMRFIIYPKLLSEISKKSSDCRVGANRLFVDLGKFKYTTAIEAPREQAINGDADE